jgi:hypothetical protein
VRISHPSAVGSSSGERFCDGRQLLVEASHQFPQVDEQAPIARVVPGPCTDIAQDQAKMSSQNLDFPRLFVTEHVLNVSARVGGRHLGR